MKRTIIFSLLITLYSDCFCFTLAKEKRFYRSSPHSFTNLALMGQIIGHAMYQLIHVWWGRETLIISNYTVLNHSHFISIAHSCPLGNNCVIYTKYSNSYTIVFKWNFIQMKSMQEKILDSDNDCLMVAFNRVRIKLYLEVLIMYKLGT